MKKNYITSLFFLIIITSTHFIQGKSIVYDEETTSFYLDSCDTDIVNINTGYDHVNQSTYSVGNYDPFWILVESPDPNISLPRPAFVLQPNGAWDVLANSTYLSPYTNASLNANNPSPDLPYGFETYFCVNEDGTEVVINMSAFADNNVDIYLQDASGTNIASLLTVSSQTSSAFQSPPIMTSNTLILNAGNYSIRADLRNLSGVAMGFNMTGTIEGASLIETLCCQPNSIITGMKYNDSNCNGIKEGNEVGLENWEIILCDQWGTTISSTLTDEEGLYSFTDVPPGDYIIKENLQSGWIPSMPLSGFYQFSILDPEVKIFNFGNCESENVCDVLSCQSDSVIINTGYDPVTVTTGTVGSFDGFWTVTQSPNNLNIPRPAYLLNPNSAWHNQPYTSWISPFANSSFNINNPSPDLPYSIDYCFCVCESETEITINLNALVDNNLDINLIDENGNLVSPLLSITDQTAGAFQLPATATANTIVLNEGNYCIRADLRNLSGVAMGVNIQGTLIGASLLESICCSTEASITGMKYNDLNCDGIQGANEPGLADWQIVICDPTGIPLDTILTDTTGFYSFTDLEPSEYIVKEIQQNGWSQLDPVDEDGHVVNLLPRQVRSNVNFGNCQISCDPCTDNMVQNPGFEMQGDSFVENWTINTSSPQINETDYCANPVSIQMWGNKDVGESIRQTGLNFEGGHTYEISFCGKFLPQTNPTNYVQFGFTASNGFLNPFTDINQYNIGSTAIDEVNNEEWACITLEAWTPSTNFSDLIINCFNNNADMNDPTNVSWGRIDNLCISEVESQCSADFNWEISDCEFFFNDLSNSINGIYSWNWNFDDPNSGDANMSFDQFSSHSFSNNGVFNICLTVMAEGECESTICKEVTIDCVPVDLNPELQVLEIFDLYPNPVSDVMTLSSLVNIQEEVEIRIFTIKGRYIQSLVLDRLDSVTPINISNLGEGVYFIEVKNNRDVLYRSTFVKM